MIFTFFESIIRWGTFLGDTIITIWFFSTLESRGKREEFAGLLLLLPLAIFYDISPWEDFQEILFGIFGEQLFLIFRVLLRCLLTWAYLKVSKEKASCNMLYLAVFFNLLRVSANIRSGFFKISGFEGQQKMLVTCSNLLLEILVTLTVHKFIQLKKMKAGSHLNWIIMSIGILTVTFFKTTLSSATQTLDIQTPLNVIIYALFSTMGFLVIFILIEAHRQMLEEQNRLEQERIISEYNYQNLRRAQKSGQDIQLLYHDMKNHLAVIRELNGDNEKLADYLDALQPRFSQYESLVDTGSETVDWLLSEKINTGRLHGIQFNVYMDLRRISFIAPIDLVAIFGNMIDNAIEAAEEVKDLERRRIYLKSSVSAGFLMIKCVNPYCGSLYPADGRLLTRKPDGSAHGLGLESITESVRHYDGTVNIQCDNNAGKFILTLAFPLDGAV